MYLSAFFIGAPFGMIRQAHHKSLRDHTRCNANKIKAPFDTSFGLLRERFNLSNPANPEGAEGDYYELAKQLAWHHSNAYETSNILSLI